MPDIHAAIVYAAQGLNVTMSMVQGKVLYRDGQFLTLDPEEVKGKALEAARKLGVI
jgi:5-methylthioadenosine/S-adenosylhomocysteine deaminase